MAWPAPRRLGRHRCFGSCCFICSAVALLRGVLRMPADFWTLGCLPSWLWVLWLSCRSPRDSKFAVVGAPSTAAARRIASFEFLDKRLS